MEGVAVKKQNTRVEKRRTQKRTKTHEGKKKKKKKTERKKKKRRSLYCNYMDLSVSHSKS